jgi:hypothetical protein
VLTAVSTATTPAYQWSLNGTAIGGATNGSYTATAGGAYTVAITDQATGCNSAISSSVSLTINAQPTAIVITPSAPAVCVGSSTTLSLTGGNIINPGTLALIENFNNSAPTWTIANGQTSPVAANWSFRNAPLTYASPNGEGSFTNFSTPNGGKFILAVADAGGNGSTTNTVISSPVFNTTNFTSANLVIEHAYKYSAPNEAKIEVSTNGGTSWTTLKTYTASEGSTGNNAQVAKKDTISMAGYLNQTNLRIRFNYLSNYGFWWLIDNAIVIGTQEVPTTYAWTPSATLNTSTGTTVIATPTAQTTYTVTATSQYGCTRTQDVTATMITRPTASISGTGIYCAGQTSTTSLSIAVTGSGPWSGTLSNGQSFSGSSSPIAVSVAPTSTTTYTVATLSDASCTAISSDLSGSALVTINPIPAAPTATVVNPTCATGTGTINVTSPLGAGFTYSIGGAFQSSTAFAGVNPGTVTLSVNNVYGCASAATTSVVVPAQPFIPTTPAAPTGIANVCPYVGNGTVLTYRVAAVPGATSYTWSLPPYVSLVGQPASTTITTVAGLTNSIDVVLSSDFISPGSAYKQIRVRASSICGTSAQSVFYLTAVRPTTPSAITASTSFICPNIGTNVPVIYRIPKVASTSSYVWELTTNGVPTTTATLTNLYSGANDTAVSITFASGFTTSVLSVYSVNDCGTSANSRTFTIVRANPSTPSLISGPSNACEYIGTAAQTATYFVSAVSGVDTYTWTLPVGATNVTGQGTNTVSFKYPAGYTGGTISVTAGNGCGTSTSRSLNVRVLAAAIPSQIDVINVSTCPNRVYSYTIAGLPSNATSVVWNIPAGATLVSGQGTTSITVAYPSTAVVGSVIVQALNNCSLSSPRESKVKLGACASGFTSGNPYTKPTTVTTPSADMQVKLFPNPSTTNFNLQVITAGTEEITVRLLDVEGRFIQSVKVAPYQTVSFGSELKAGPYMVEVRQGKKVTTTRVIKF